MHFSYGWDNMGHGAAQGITPASKYCRLKSSNMVAGYLVGTECITDVLQSTGGSQGTDNPDAFYLRAPSVSSAGGEGDPHLSFAHGGVADFRGRHDTFYVMHSSPGFQFATRSVNTSFLLPRPQLVHGTFFTEVAFRVRGRSGREYGIKTPSDDVRFAVIDIGTNVEVVQQVGEWKQWWEDGIRVYTKQFTTYVRANGWEVNSTRHPIYNYVSGPSRRRFDFTVRPLKNMALSSHHGNASATCYPHGIVGQSFDGDGIGISGRVDDYTYNVSYPVVTTRAMAEGAIEGRGFEYALNTLFSTEFAFSRYDRSMDDTCPPRKVESLTGTRSFGDTHLAVAHTLSE